MILKSPSGSVYYYYLLAIALMALALFVRLAIAPVDVGLQYVTFFPAVTLAAVIGGLRPGLLATAIGLVFATVIFTPPYYSFSSTVLYTSFWPNMVFLMDGIIVSVSIDTMHRYRQQYAKELQQSTQAHAALQASTQHFSKILDNLFSYVALLDTDGVIQEINKAALDRSGLSREDAIGKCFYDGPWWCYDEKVRSQLLEAAADVRQGQTRRYDVLVKMGDDLVAIDFQISPVRDEQGQIIGLLPTAVDITARKQAEEALRIAAVTFETHEAIMITDADANILRVNQAFEEITGYSAEEVAGKTPRILKSGRHETTFYVQMWHSLLTTGAWSGEVWDRRKSGEIYPKQTTITSVKNDHGETTHYISIFSDISRRKKAEEEIYNLAFYDVLTGLPNRRLLLDRLRLALSASARNKLHGALLFLDLDNFKTLNDTLGHDYGDMLLVEVAKRIRYCVREMDTVARLGGDEFVVFIENISADTEEASQNVAQVAEKIRAVLNTPYQLNDNTYHSSPSIGVCLFYDNIDTVEELIKRADMAMYQAKDAGRNKVQFFDSQMQHALETRAALEADLRRAIANRQLQLFYQIQRDHNHHPIGAEALVRWVHPELGMMLPSQFIHIAEESPLILEIGNWILDAACQQIAAWSQHESTRNLVLSVNISAKQIQQADFVQQLETVIRKHRIQPAHLKLEFTESLALGDIDTVVMKMLAIKQDLGVTLSLDDFGTVYSSLSYLKRLPLDQIKTGQNFVRDLNEDSTVMVKTIIDMAQNFGLEVIAEGVETEAQLTFLKENGCMAFQGYLFSKPVPLEEFETLLKQG